MHDIERCRTAPLGGQVDPCETCRAYHDRDPSWKNRHGPKCQQDQAEQGLAHHARLLLPAPHFLGTFPLPAALSALARRHQQTLDNRLSRSSSEALQALAWAPRFIDGRIGRVGVLHTWTHALRYHPHVHVIVAGGGLAAEGPWLPARQDCLVPVKPLAVSFRAKVRAQRHKTDRFPQVANAGWNTAGGVHCAPVGTGKEALRELAPSILRVALSHHRSLKREDDRGTLQYKDSATAQVSTGTVTAEECIRRFLQPVLPDRFSTVHYDGFLSPGNRHLLSRIRELRGASTVEPTTSGQHQPGTAPTPPREAPRGPTCGSLLRLGELRRPTSRWPP